MTIVDVYPFTHAHLDQSAQPSWNQLEAFVIRPGSGQANRVELFLAVKMVSKFLDIKGGPTSGSLRLFRQKDNQFCDNRITSEFGL